MWEGKWSVSRVINPIDLEIVDGVRTRVVYVNCLQHRVQPQLGDGTTGNLNTFAPVYSDHWVSPQVDHAFYQPFLHFQHCGGDALRAKDILQIDFCLEA